MPAPAAAAFFTAANLLTLARLPLGGLFWLVVGATPHRPWAALGVLALAALTDVLDGPLARRRGKDRAGSGSNVGAWLDPVCDKLFVGAVLAALHFERGVSLGLLALMVLRELFQLPMTIVYGLVPSLRHLLRYDFRANRLGKNATIVQFAALGALVAGLPARPLIYLAAGLGVAALGDYVRRAVALGRAHRAEAR